MCVYRNGIIYIYRTGYIENAPNKYKRYEMTMSGNAFTWNETEAIIDWWRQTHSHTHSDIMLDKPIAITTAIDVMHIAYFI